MTLQQNFIEEVDLSEIVLQEVVGRGTFGTVKKGVLRGQTVAVKLIETEQEIRSFVTEVRQLSRVDHPNIVKLLGASTRPGHVCLVMEYAEGGSLYNVLHEMNEVHFSASHSISWAYQCAKGVAYLHAMEPVPLVHRDLKPPNLLLVMGGTVLKICDFGTACDKQTNMTNNKGSAAWMAPEVFKSSNYSEKCDIYSWGIILWEVLTRQKPFDDIGGGAFRIMWAVSEGQRPPLIRGCPRSLERLMVACWAANPNDRPSMNVVVEQIIEISRYFPGADIPITYPNFDDMGVVNRSADFSVSDMEGDLSANLDLQSFNAGSLLPIRPPELILPNLQSYTSGSAPPSLAGSQENIAAVAAQRNLPLDLNKKQQSTDLSLLHSEQKTPKHMGHKRSCSYGGSSAIPSPVVPLKVITDEKELIQNYGPEATWDQQPPRKISWPYDLPRSDSVEFNAYLLLEPKFQPLPPASQNQESMELFESHRKLAQSYLQVQTEIEILLERRKEIDRDLNEDKQKINSCLTEYLQLKNEKECLQQLKQNLKKQLEIIKDKQRKRHKDQSNDEWVVIDNSGL